MSSVNKVILVGRLGANPEFQVTSGGASMTRLSVATDRKWRDGDGELRSETQWTRVVVFGRTADNCAEYLKKGQQVYVEGRLRTSSWEDRDGNRRWSTDVVAREVVFLGRSRRNGNEGEKSEGNADPFDVEFGDDDLPF